MAVDPRQASEKLAAAIAESARVIANLSASAKELSRLSTETLLGVLGGSSFSLIAYEVTLLSPASSWVLVPLAAAVGLSGGITLSRTIRSGSSERKEEERRVAIDRNREIARLLLEEMNKPGTSKAEKERIARHRTVLNDDLAAMGLLAHDKQIVGLESDSKRLPPPPAV